MIYDMRSEHDLSLLEALVFLWRRRWTLLLAAVVAAVIGYAASFLFRPVYKAEVLVVPQASDSGSQLGGLAKRFSGVAGLAGINLPSQGGNEQARIASLTTYSSIAGFIEAEHLQDLILAETRLPNWVSQFDADRGSMWEAVREFREYYSVVTDKDTGQVTVVVTWFDPATAAKWANAIVSFVDQRERERTITTSDRRIAVLNERLDKTQIADLRAAVLDLIQNEMRSLIVAKADAEYAFQVLDRAVPAERPVRPRRLIIGGVSGALTLMILSFVLLARESVSQARSQSECDNAATLPATVP
jgi:capsular polysaccharide biosynthesis protein